MGALDPGREPGAGSTPDRRTGGALALVLAVGVGLRLWQAAANPSLWLDELAVVRNIVHLPLLDLVSRPLAYDQIAPPGFLAAGRLLHSVVPDADWPFRLAPLVASVLAIPLVFGIGRRLAGETVGLTAAALLAVSPPLVGFAWVAKQYSLDVAVTAALTLGALHVVQDGVGDRRKLLALGTAGGALLFFSYPGVIAGVALWVAVAFLWAMDRPEGWSGRLLALGLPLGAGALVVTLVALHVRSPGTADHMATFWAAGFPGSWAGIPAWLWRQAPTVLDASFLTPYPPSGGRGRVSVALTVVAGVGLVRIALGRRREGVFLVALPVAAVVAAAVHLYPLSGRISLFLAPALAVLVAAGFDLAGTVVRRRSVQAAGAAACIAVPALALVDEPPPYGVEHTRPLLLEVSRERRPGDRVYSYYAANQAVDYYGERFGLGDWVAGTCNRGDPGAYLAELDRFRGEERLWVVFTHALPLYGEPEIMLRYLGTIGREVARLDDQMDEVMTSAWLFDLSDPLLLHRATAEGFDPEALAPDPRFRCGRGPHAQWRRPVAAGG